MNPLEIQDLLSRLDERSGNMSSDIKEIIELQKIANGRTSKNENRIVELEKWRAESHGHWKATTVIGSIIGAIAGLIAAILFR